MSREQSVATTFVELADSLVEDFDVVDLTALLTERCIELLDADAAGLLLTGGGETLRLLAATSEALETVEIFQIQSDEGPCRDCVRSGSPITTRDLAADGRWPRFAPVALAAGFRAAHAFPLRLRGQVLGALNLFRSEATALTRADASLAQAFADVATIALLQGRAVHDAHVVADQLQEALNSRVAIEQAKGIVSEWLGCGVDEAFAVLRRRARERQQLLGDLVQQVVDGAVRPADLGGSRR